MRAVPRYPAPRTDAVLVHYTLGGPYSPENAHCEYSAEWRAERDAMLSVSGRGKQGSWTASG